jgi:sterol desaturase/sphingolipid hydroxylase (fatty acid hydroxylase superfamily)
MEYLSIRDIEPKHEGSKKLFGNPVLDKLSRSHISIPISMLLLFGVLFIYWGTIRTSLLFWEYIVYYLVGLLSFTLFEYLMHRYLYHMVPTSKIKGWLQYNLHGVHHEYPKDKTRLAMPPAVIVIAAFLFLFGFKLLLGDLTYAFTPGFMAGYAGYLSVHYIVHAFQPPKNFFKTLWINHSIHHYKDPDVAFGVSSPLWDHVFRTLPKKRKRS